MEKAKILFDTDLGCDCDDTAALALCMELMNAGECELLAVTHCTMCEAAGGVIEAMLRYYGHPEIPVGSFHAEDHLPTREWRDVYASKVAASFENRFRDGEHYENSVALMRRILAASEEKVRLVATGPLTSIARLLQSQPDEASELTGVELVREKVECGYLMAGCFADHWPSYGKTVEWNILCDIAAMRAVCDLWPVDLVCLSSEIGTPIVTGSRIQLEGSRSNPMRMSFELFHEECGDNGSGRCSWDPATMLYAIRPDAGYWDLSARGILTTAENGQTTLTPAPDGRHAYLIEKMPVPEVQAAIDEILNRDLER